MDNFSDIAFFKLLALKGTLAATAQEMGVTPPSLSKRLAALENRLGVRLMHRTTRRMSLTPEGELFLSEGSRLLEEIDELERKVAGSKAKPRGLLRICATLGFGRRHIAPALTQFSNLFSDVEVQLHLSDQPMNIVEQGFDVSVRFGDAPDSRLTARKVANNRRVLCATPAYLERAGEPITPRELQQHSCIVLRENNETFGTWHLNNGSRQETIKVRGPMSSNDGDCTMMWALNSKGVLMRSEWDVADYIRSGELRILLADWELPPADIYLVFQTKENLSAKTRALIDFMVTWFEEHRLNSSRKSLSNW